MSAPVRKAALAGLGLLALAHAVVYLGPFEDAYITFRYVDNLLAGHGFSFNPGERVEGFTSFGWLVLLTGFGAVGLSPEFVATLLSLIFGVGLVLLTERLARRYVPDAEGGYWLTIGAAALVTANGTLAFYAGTGMETTLFACLVTCAATACLRSGRRGALSAGLWLASASLVRPEGVGYAGLFTLSLALCREQRRDALALGAAYFCAFAPYYAWRTAYFGFPLPNTYYAKASPSLELFWAGFLHLERYLTPHLVWLVFPALGWLLTRRGPTREVWLAGFVICGAMLNYVFVGGDVFPFHRFMLPAMPVIAIVLVVSAHGMLGARRWMPAVAALIVWTAILPFLPRFSLQGALGRPMATIAFEVQTINRKYFAVGDWMRRRFEPGTLVALNAVGIIPQRCGFPTIDMLGLNDTHIAHVDVSLGRGVRGHEKYDADYVLARRPDLILPGIPVPLTVPRRDGSGRTSWTPILPSDATLLDHPNFHATYRAVEFSVNDSGYLMIFVRRDFEVPARD